MVVNLTELYFGSEKGKDKPRRSKLYRRVVVPQQLKKRKASVLATSINVMEDNWVEVERREVHTPYGKGTVIAENVDRTHFKIWYRRGVFRRVVKRNCTDKMKLSGKEYQDRYKKDKSVVTTTGRAYRGVNDPLKNLGSDEAVLETACALNGIDFSKYSHLNPGQQRMCIGNVLRGRLRKGQDVFLGEDDVLTARGWAESVAQG